jgi:hypothetical protein
MTGRHGAWVLLLATAACDGGTRTGDTTRAAAAASVIQPAARATTDAKGCVHDGRWRPCGLVDRLEKSGLVVKTEPDSAHYDFLTVPGVRYTVGRGEVQAFFYDDTARMARDVAGVDTVRVTKAGTVRHWDVHPTFVRSGNLVVILLTLSEQLMERVQLAVQAGAPQPEPPPGSESATPLPPAKVP